MENKRGKKKRKSEASTTIFNLNDFEAINSRVGDSEVKNIPEIDPNLVHEAEISEREFFAPKNLCDFFVSVILLSMSWDSKLET